MGKKGKDEGDSHHAPPVSKTRRRRPVAPRSDPDGSHCGFVDPRYTSRWWSKARDFDLSSDPVNTEQRTKVDEDEDEDD